MDENIKGHVDKLLSYMKEEAYKPLTVQELEEAFGIEGSTNFKDFVKALVVMEEKGLVVRTRSNRYGLPEKMNLVRGKVSAHAKGFAFVIPEESGMDDIFIPPNETNNAMHGDIVLGTGFDFFFRFKKRRDHRPHRRTRCRSNGRDVH